MRFHVTALAITAGLFWGGAILLVGAANAVWPSYGLAFLNLAASVYPGYHPGAGMGSVITGTFYGVVDGAIGGAILAWIYNFVADRLSGSA